MKGGGIVLLTDCGIAKRTTNALAKKNMFTTRDITTFVPRKYKNYTRLTPLLESGGEVVIQIHVEWVKKENFNEQSMITVSGIELEKGEKIRIVWFGAAHLYEYIKSCKQKDVIACGKIVYNMEYENWSMTCPDDFKKVDDFKYRIVPVYSNIKNVSEDMLKSLMKKFLPEEKEVLSPEQLNIFQLLSYPEALKELHRPRNYHQLKKAKERFLLQDFLYFITRLNAEKESCKNEDIGFQIKDMQTMVSLLDLFPYELTMDQKKALDAIVEKMQAGERINALVQGDVGCGKTIIALLLMFFAAGNGHQAVLMAPTTVLAKQHYEDIQRYAVALGFQAALLTSEVKGSRKKKIVKQIENGEVQLIVGTQSVFSDSVVYKNLAIVITDEEHRFGVRQRNLLQEKAKTGAHVINMSATPIPRSLASIFYDESKDIFNIKTMPKGRQPIQTAINASDAVIFRFMEKQIQAGHQAYVVCPFIEEGSEGMEGIESVASTETRYKNYFQAKGIEVGTVTGAMKTEEVEESIVAFKEGRTKILIATTVIEVGVNIPAANTIVIENAERFGLAQLHQLRGRVGRGTDKAYCILKSLDKQNERLKIMTETTSGFEIAEKDFELRGSGNVIGTEQSGNNKYISLILQYPKGYELAKEIYSTMTDEQKEELLKAYE